MNVYSCVPKAPKFDLLPSEENNLYLPFTEFRSTFQVFFFFFVTHSSLLSSTYTLLDQLISPKIFDAGEVTNKFELMFGTEDKR